MPTLPIVSYLRVSTSRQGRSGLGIEAQRENIARFAATEGYEVIGEYAEVETGKGSDALERRPQLTAALNAARKRKGSGSSREARPPEPGRSFHLRAYGPQGAVHRD
jgi:DNA invertase Pin-like site-specific DNA recombinase